MQRFVTAHSQFIASLMGNPFIYFLVMFIVYMFNGVDEVLLTLLVLNVINVTFTLIGCWRKDLKEVLHAISYRLKMYIIVCFGVVIDRVLGIQSTEHIVSLRNYLILFYSHHEIMEVYNFLTRYDFYMPKSLRKYIKGEKE